MKVGATAGRPRSRLLASLEDGIKKAASPIEVLCLRAERAGLLARQGQLERAQVAIDELRAQIAWQPHNAVVRGWVALAEGLHGHHSVIGEGGRVAIELAYNLSREGSGPAAQRLRATAAAWLAALVFGDDDPASLGSLLRESFDASAADHHGARARAAVVTGIAYHYGGQAARAQRWYEASRQHAIAEGDETHLSALMHNQAWMRAHAAHVAALFEQRDDSLAVTQALMSAESIGHYDAGVGMASLPSLVPVLRAQVLTAQGRWADALALFDANFDSAMHEGLKRMAADLLADRAWCELHLGRSDKARALAGAADQALTAPMHADDRMVALARLAQVRDALGQASAAAAHRSEALSLYSQHGEQQQRMVGRLDEALAGLDPKTL